MTLTLNYPAIWAIGKRTFRQSVESPIAYVVAIFFYGFVGGIFGMNFLRAGLATVSGVGILAPWILWFVVPALTMNLISDEIRTGTFESLSTLPLRDEEIVLGKYLGFVLLGAFLIGGLLVYPIVVSFLSGHPDGLDWGAGIGVLAGLFFVTAFYGSMGLWASSLAKSPVVALILGMIFCTVFFFLGQLSAMFPGFLAGWADFFGIGSHMETLGRGVWDLRDLFYFASGIFVFLYLTVQRLATRRF